MTIGVDAGSRDRLALGVLAQYRMATTEQMHRVIAPEVRIEQTRRRLARLRAEGLVDRITLPQSGRARVRFPTGYGVQLVSEWPEMRGRRPSRTVSDRVLVRAALPGAVRIGEVDRDAGLDRELGVDVYGVITLGEPGGRQRDVPSWSF